MAQYNASTEDFKALQAKLDALTAVSKILSGTPPRQLLVLDVDSGRHPHTAVAVGDVAIVFGSPASEQTTSPSCTYRNLGDKATRADRQPAYPTSSRGP